MNVQNIPDTGDVAAGTPKRQLKDQGSGKEYLNSHDLHTLSTLQCRVSLLIILMANNVFDLVVFVRFGIEILGYELELLWCRVVCK